MLKSLTIAMVAFVATASAGQAKEYIVNGGFETGDFSGYSTSNLDFTFVASSGAPIGIGVDNSHTGTYFAALGNIRLPGTISQTFADHPGDALTISFYYAANGTPGTLSASFNGGVPFFAVVDPDTASSYVHVVTSALATGSDTLTFTEQNIPDYFLLDDISVSSFTPSIGAPAPIAGAGLLPLLGLAGVFFLRGRGGRPGFRSRDV